MATTDIATDSPRHVVGHYSVLRYVPDSLREEAINIGLFVVAEDISWGRFDARVPKSILQSLNRRADADRIQKWVERLKTSYSLEGDAGWPPGDRIARETLADWSREWGGVLRLSEPKVALAPDLDELWTRLYRRLVRRDRRPVTSHPAESAVSEVPAVRMTAQQERQELLGVVKGIVGRWPLLHPDRVVYDSRLQGEHVAHRADVAFMNGSTVAIGQVLPLQWGDEDAVIVARALITEAAADFPADVVKLAIYADPPPARAEVLLRTADYFTDLPPRMRVELVEVGAFDELEDRITPLLALHG